MEYETIEYKELEKGIGQIALNRPRRYNSVSIQMMEELEHVWSVKRNDLDTHVQNPGTAVYGKVSIC